MHPNSLANLTYGRLKEINERGEKRCSLCREWKPIDDFFLRHRQLGHLDRTSRCKKCNGKYATKWSNENYSTTRARTAWLRSYGLSVEDYEAMLNGQGGGCAICGQTKPRRGRVHLPIDHCHKTGKIRGILCDTCNRAIGLLKDDKCLLLKAAAYLEKWDDGQ